MLDEVRIGNWHFSYWSDLSFGHLGKVRLVWRPVERVLEPEPEPVCAVQEVWLGQIRRILLVGYRVRIPEHQSGV